jgi:hypothetical protein
MRDPYVSDYEPPFNPHDDGRSGFLGDDDEGIYIPPQGGDRNDADADAAGSDERGADQTPPRHEHPAEQAEQPAQPSAGHSAGGSSDPASEPWVAADSDADDDGDERPSAYPDLGALTNAGRHAVAAPPPPVAAPEPEPVSAPATPVEHSPAAAPAEHVPAAPAAPTAAPVTPPAAAPVTPTSVPADQGPAPVAETAEPPQTRAQARSARAKKPGPKPMTDEPTVRVEGQLYVTQQTAGVATLARLKVENRAVPAAERRRLSINTLIRIGMTIVLEHADELHGKTEAELMESLRAALRDSGRTER